MPSSTQLAVIGAGPGGYAAAFYAADRGMQVALVDPADNPGGVCLYRGCIPSKALLHIAKVIDEAHHAEAWGVSFGAPSIDVERVRAFKNKVVAQLTSGVGQVGRMRKINYIQGHATFRDAHSVEIARKGSSDPDILTFEHAVIATGSRPSTVPGLSIDSPRVMDSTAALDLPDIPKSLLVVGGGYIGLELGSVYAALGSKVTIVEMTPGLLPGADRDLVNILTRRIESISEGVLLNTKVVSMKEAGDGIRVVFEGQVPEGMPKERTFDRVLVCVGRRPNSNVPGLDRTRVAINPRGFIEVNEARAT
ncbi:MAG TPA: FAD-dependent oxidoreductase, partial [Vicinamibacterales bacterium]|nr:FAD-dependent oxidoreductase [Vicinamibacterales bacterium]